MSDVQLQAAIGDFNSASQTIRASANLTAARRLVELNNVKQAMYFFNRAFQVAGCTGEALEALFEHACLLEDFVCAKNTLRDALIAAANQRRFDDVAILYKRWLYFDVPRTGVEDYQYDYGVLSALKESVSDIAVSVNKAEVMGNKKRLLYVCSHIAFDGSILAKIMLAIAQYSDLTAWDIAIAFSEPTESLEAVADCAQLMAFSRTRGIAVFVEPSKQWDERLPALIQSIVSWQPELLVTNAALSGAEGFMLAQAIKGVTRCGLVYAGPQQFTGPWFDHNIVSHNRFAMECPGEISVIPVDLALPKMALIESSHREAVGIPNDVPLLVAAGRSPKFSSRLAEVINTCLLELPSAWVLILGVASELPTPFYRGLDESIRDRIKFLSWSKDYLPLLKMADVMVDTFPSGGGFTIIDAMALGIPVVGFEDDLLVECKSDQVNVASSLLPPELLLPAGDDKLLAAKLIALLQDTVISKNLGDLCRTHISSSYGRPGKMITRYEAVYKQLLSDRFNSKS